MDPRYQKNGGAKTAPPAKPKAKTPQVPKEGICDICETKGQIVRCEICQKKLCSACVVKDGDNIHCHTCHDQMVVCRVDELLLWAKIAPGICSTVCPECDRSDFSKEELAMAIAANKNFSKAGPNCPVCGSAIFDVNL